MYILKSACVVGILGELKSFDLMIVRQIKIRQGEKHIGQSPEDTKHRAGVVLTHGVMDVSPSQF